MNRITTNGTNTRIFSNNWIGSKTSGDKITRMKTRGSFSFHFQFNWLFYVDSIHLEELFWLNGGFFFSFDVKRNDSLLSTALETRQRKEKKKNSLVLLCHKTNTVRGNSVTRERSYRECVVCVIWSWEFVRSLIRKAFDESVTNIRLNESGWIISCWESYTTRECWFLLTLGEEYCECCWFSSNWISVKSIYDWIERKEMVLMAIELTRFFAYSSWSKIVSGE